MRLLLRTQPILLRQHQLGRLIGHFLYIASFPTLVLTQHSLLHSHSHFQLYQSILARCSCFDQNHCTTGSRNVYRRSLWILILFEDTRDVIYHHMDHFTSNSSHFHCLFHIVVCIVYYMVQRRYSYTKRSHCHASLCHLWFLRFVLLFLFFDCYEKTDSIGHQYHQRSMQSDGHHAYTYSHASGTSIWCCIVFDTVVYLYDLFGFFW